LENKYVPLHKRLENIDEIKITLMDKDARKKLIDTLDEDEISAAWMHDSYKRMEAVQYAQKLQKQIDELKAKYEPKVEEKAATAEQPPKKRFGVKAAA
jgi:hypothetical protein